MSEINLYTSMFKFSQLTDHDLTPAACKFILNNMGALALKEPSVLVGLIGEMASHIIRTETTDKVPLPDFTPPSSYKRHSRHLGDWRRYDEKKLLALANGFLDRSNPDYVSPCVAMAELDRRRPRDWNLCEEERKWVAENGDSREHYGIKIDLSYNETREFLKDCRMIVYTEDSSGWGYRRIECKVLYQREWWDLSRTDLKDNVATGRGHLWEPQANRDAWIRNVRYGARLNRWTEDLRSFSIIDAFSDG